MKRREDDLLRSLISSLGLIEAPRLDTFDAIKLYEYQNDCLYLGQITDAVLYLPQGTPDVAIDHALHQLRGEGASRDPRVRAALYQLWLTTKHEKMSETDRDNMILEFARRMDAYPPEAGLMVLSQLSSSSHFFPAWADIKGGLDNALGWRTRLISGLTRARTRMKGD